MEECRDNIDNLMEWYYFIDMLDIIDTLYNPKFQPTKKGHADKKLDCVVSDLL